MMTAKRTARPKEQSGMFADFIELVTAEQIIRAEEAHRDRFNECNRRLLAGGEQFRERVQQLVSLDIPVKIEERFADTSGTPEYRYDFYRHELKRFGFNLEKV